MKLLVTGGAGFIGSNFIRYYLEAHPEDEIVNLDKLTYAGHLSSTKDFENNPKYKFIKGDIVNPNDVEEAMHAVDIVVHFAAESHVDRSVLNPLEFVRTNVLGTSQLLQTALKQKIKRFHHISTDEVFGSLKLEDPEFNENTKYDPRTPYSASKAGSDHMVRAYSETYGLPITITNCANNFGPFHEPEKLIPRFITNLLQDKKVPLMGKGENIREWLYAKDHASAVDLVLQKGQVGETYCVGGESKTNLEITQLILKALDKDESYIEYVPDRLGHDFRYAINDSKLRELGWKPEHTFKEWLDKTVTWYKENEWWWKPLLEERINVDREAQEKLRYKSD